MQIPSRPNHANIKAAYQKKAEERESWRRLVVKVILWQDGVSEAETSRILDKISLKEWKTYCQRTIKTNMTYGKDKVRAELKETWKIINKYSGFE